MDWVHCNGCFTQPPAAGRQFYLTSCGHIFCDRCRSQGDSRSTCPLCRSTCSMILLSTQMKPDVEMYFTDPAEMVKKATKNVLQVLDFQRSHRQRLVSRLKTSSQGGSSEMVQQRVKELERQNQLLRQKGQFLVDENQKLRSESQLLRDENMEMKRLLASRTDGTAGGGGRHYMQTVIATPSPSPGLCSLQTSLPSVYNTVLVGHSTPSPMRCSQSSPVTGIGHRVLPATPGGSQNISCYPQQVPRTPSGPVRVSIRTPPSGGKMGTVPSSGIGIRRSTPGGHITRQPSTACLTPSLPYRESSQLTTPSNSLSVSQMSRLQSQSVPLPASQIGRSVRSPQTLSPRMVTGGTVATGEWDPSRRQICLRYQSRNELRRPLLMNSVGPLMSQSNDRF